MTESNKLKAQLKGVLLRPDRDWLHETLAGPQAWAPLEDVLHNGDGMLHGALLRNVIRELHRSKNCPLLESDMLCPGMFEIGPWVCN